jgi:hypothetical protein
MEVDASFLLSKELNMSAINRGISPSFSLNSPLDLSNASPCDSEPIVYVFPDPVWPYATTVALYPFKKASKSGGATSPYKSLWETLE